jgi:hypothetical protein
VFKRWCCGGSFYGSRAANGSMITTKSGRNQGLGMEYSSSIIFNQVNSSLQDFKKNMVRELWE